MLNINSNTLFINKYKPNSLEEFKLSSEFLDIIKLLIQLDKLNILFIGNPGSGKTTLLLPLPQKPANTLRLQLRALVSAQHPQQRVGVLIDGRSEQQFTLTSPSSQTIEIVLPNYSTPQRLVKIELNLPDRIRPKNLGMGNDDRELAIGLESASFH